MAIARPDRFPTSHSLKLLRELMREPNRERYGLDLARAIGASTSSVYPILGHLVGGGYLDVRDEGADPMEVGRGSRRFYKLSADGRLFAERELADQEERLSGMMGTRQRAVRQINGRRVIVHIDSVLDEFVAAVAAEQETNVSDVVRRALMVYKLVSEQEGEGHDGQPPDLHLLG